MTTVKSTVEEIRQRFDQDVERFSNLETGQVSTIDAVLSLELITEGAKRLRPSASAILDIGCGAGNYTLKMLSKLPGLECTIIDLSKPMLEKAVERITAVTDKKVCAIQADIRDVELPSGRFDIILAGAVLHHLREDGEWLSVFRKLQTSLKEGGCLFVSDLITQDNPVLEELIRVKYADYLRSVGGNEYSKKVLDYIEKEDSPRSLQFQFGKLQEAGFSFTEVLHKNLCFAAYVAIK